MLSLMNYTEFWFIHELGSGLQRLLKSLHHEIFLTTSVNNNVQCMIVMVFFQIPMTMLILGSSSCPQSPADGALDLMAAFIKELEGLSSMAGSDLSDIIDNLLIPQQQTFHNAVQVWQKTNTIHIWIHICITLLIQIASA